jgi:hypothetical protein
MQRDSDFYLSPEGVDEDDARALANGQIVTEAINTTNSAINVMLDCARRDYLAALRGLIDVDLKTTDGIATALKLQAEAQRYLDLIQWIRNIATQHDVALAKSRGETLEEGNPY